MANFFNVIPNSDRKLGNVEFKKFKLNSTGQFFVQNSIGFTHGMRISAFSFGTNTMVGLTGWSICCEIILFIQHLILCIS